MFYLGTYSGLQMDEVQPKFRMFSLGLSEQRSVLHARCKPL